MTIQNKPLIGAGQITLNTKTGFSVSGSGSQVKEGFVTAAHVVLSMVKGVDNTNPYAELLALRELDDEGLIKVLSGPFYIPFSKQIDAVVIVTDKFKERFSKGSLEISTFSPNTSSSLKGPSSDSEKSFLSEFGLGATQRRNNGSSHPQTPEAGVQPGDSGAQFGGYTAALNLSVPGIVTNIELDCYLPNITSVNGLCVRHNSRSKDEVHQIEVIPIKSWKTSSDAGAKELESAIQNGRGGSHVNRLTNGLSKILQISSGFKNAWQPVERIFSDFFPTINWPE